MYSSGELRDMIQATVGPDKVPRNITVFEDTSNFIRIGYDDVVILGGRPYLIRHNEREGRFGIEEEPKYWVKRSIDLIDGSMKIIKLTFYEQFLARIGDMSYERYRSPKKEARILDLVASNDSFMHGISIKDSADNIVRIIDYITGTTLADHVLQLGADHEDYFYNHFPHVLDQFIILVEAIKFLHDNGEKHGDIRRDHIIKEKKTGICKWIDFDFNYLNKESLAGYDLFSLGNVIVYLAGRGDKITWSLKEENPELFGRVNADDLNIVFNNRVVNLKKIYPYIPEGLNRILMHFSSGTEVFYEYTDEFLSDIKEARQGLGS